MSDAKLENAILRNLLGHTTRAYEDQVRALSAEKELALVTLASIADGVITTDPEERIEYLNPVAENLTGWSIDEARDRPLNEIFRLVTETTGEPIEPPPGWSLAKHGTVRLMDRTTLLRRDGARFAVESSLSPIRDSEDRLLGTVIVFQDVSEKRLLALQLAHQATHDALTGLLNRQAFDARLHGALAEARGSAQLHALAYLDLDQFKLVNDTCGHFAGDELLVRVTRLLQEEVSEDGIVARLGGDEFALLLPTETIEDAHQRVTAIHRSLEQLRFRWQDKTFTCRASIGLVPVEPEFESVAHLLSAADHACYVAKDKGRNRIQVYLPAEAEFVRRYGEMDWVVRIQRTLEEDRFILYGQTVQPLAVPDDGLRSFEVLLRMEEEPGQVHNPSEFIRAAERYGLMRSIDRWVIGATLNTLAELTPEELAGVGLCWINLSAVSLGDETFLPFILRELERTGIPVTKICLEITETAAIANLAQAKTLMRELSRRGCRFALDDFGSGMSSYGYLKDLSVDYLKIDGHFIQDMVTDRLDRAMVDSVHRLGHLLGMRTVAESVGSQATENLLKEIGVDYIQGNWIDPPKPLGQLVRATNPAGANPAGANPAGARGM
ncbi:MAG: EAL domain-containing protein [Acidobacteriota bacterium]